MIITKGQSINAFVSKKLKNIYKKIKLMAGGRQLNIEYWDYIHDTSSALRHWQVCPTNEELKP